jgi:hypothetical protein
MRIAIRGSRERAWLFRLLLGVNLIVPSDQGALVSSCNWVMRPTLADSVL